MGQSTDGILAYGYDLGSNESEWKVRELGEYGAMAVPWFDETDEDSEPASDFGTMAIRRLLDASGFTETYEDGQEGYFGREGEAEQALGVQIETYCSDESPMYLLAARVITVARGYVVPVDLAELADPATLAGYDEKLTAALAALGLTPVQDKPAWLLCSYWG